MLDETLYAQSFEPLRKSEVFWPGQTPAELAALKLVNQDVSRAESILESNAITTRWDSADRLYRFQLPITRWEGTNVPRSSLGVPLVLEHVNSLAPQLINGLFSEDPPFEPIPRPNTDMNAARAQLEILAWELEKSGFRPEAIAGIFDALLYGTGIWKWGWAVKKEKSYSYKPTSDSFGMSEKITEITLPTFEHVELRHVLIDPTLRVPDIRKAKWVAHRIYVDAIGLDRMRSAGFDIPSREELVKLFLEPAETPATSFLETRNIDIAKEFQSEPRDTASSVDPLKKPLEVIERWTENESIVVLNRKKVIRIAKNEWGQLPFCSTYFIRQPGAFYGIGVADLNGGEQRLQQGVLNAILDDLSLALNGMFIRRRGANAFPQQVRMRPGGIIDTDDMEGVRPLERPGIRPEAFQVIGDSDGRAQRRTAANEISVQGSLPNARSSVTRTAQGIQALTGAVGIRLQLFVEDFADQVFIPTLKAFKYMTPKNLKPSIVKRLLTEELSQYYNLDPVEVIALDLDYTILAAAKLQARRAILATMPQLWEFLQQPSIQEAVKGQFMKVDFNEIINMMFDATGWPNKKSIIIPMTEEEQMALAAENPTVQAAQQQQQAIQQRLMDYALEHQGKLDIIEAENLGRAGRDVIKSALKQDEMMNSQNLEAAKQAGIMAAQRLIGGGNGQQ